MTGVGLQLTEHERLAFRLKSPFPLRKPFTPQTRRQTAGKQTNRIQFTMDSPNSLPRGTSTHMEHRRGRKRTNPYRRTHDVRMSYRFLHWKEREREHPSPSLIHPFHPSTEQTRSNERPLSTVVRSSNPAQSSHVTHQKGSYESDTPLLSEGASGEGSARELFKSNRLHPSSSNHTIHSYAL